MAGVCRIDSRADCLIYCRMTQPSANDAHFQTSLDLVLSPGQRMELDLEEPASTGCLWRLAQGPVHGLVVTMERPQSRAPLPENVLELRVGAPGKMRVRLLAPDTPQSIEEHIELVLDRPFAPAEPPAKQLVLRVSVTPPPTQE